MIDIPVFIHHETGQKVQKGKDQTQAYLKSCISQAEELGNKVILFGDDANKNWCDKWVCAQKYKSGKWLEFLKVFENYSTYPDAWAKGIYYRFFAFEKYAEEHQIRRFVVLDSDILVYCNFSDQSYLLNYDFAASEPYSQNLIDMEKDALRWTVNVGLSYWTLDTLTDFLNFCIDKYSNCKEQLQQKWGYHQLKNLPGGVCEMSLIFLWVRSRPELKYLNLINPPKGLPLYNNNIMDSEEYLCQEYKVSFLTGVKQLSFQQTPEGIKPFLTRYNGEKVRVQNLHFIGVAKLMMHDIQTNRKLSRKIYLLMTYYHFRMIVGKVYRWIRGKNYV